MLLLSFEVPVICLHGNQYHRPLLSRLQISATASLRRQLLPHILSVVRQSILYKASLSPEITVDKCGSPLLTLILQYVFMNVNLTAKATLDLTHPRSVVGMLSLNSSGSELLLTSDVCIERL